MKSLRLLLIITIAITLGLAVSYAAEKPAASEKAMEPKAEKAEMKKAEKPKMPSVEGEVVSVDAAANTIVVKDKKGTESKIEVNKDTTIKKDKKDMMLQDIKSGEKVKVKYSESEGKMMAKSIKMITGMEKGKGKGKGKAMEETPKAEPEKK